MNDHRTHGAIAGFLLLTALLAGCSEAATDAATDTPDPDTAADDGAGEDPPPATDAGGAGPTVEVTGVDYAFEGLPTTVSVGTELTFTNASPTEVHELVLFRRPEGEERPVEDLLALPEEEQVLTFEGMAFAMPGEAGPVADGDLVLDEPGAYVLVCHLPVGTTPEVLESEEFAEDAAPHFAEGMVHEFDVA